MNKSIFPYIITIYLIVMGFSCTTPTEPEEPPVEKEKGSYSIISAKVKGNIEIFMKKPFKWWYDCEIKAKKHNDIYTNKCSASIKIYDKDMKSKEYTNWGIRFYGRSDGIDTATPYFSIKVSEMGKGNTFSISIDLEDENGYSHTLIASGLVTY